MITATITCAPITALKPALRSRRATRSRTGIRWLNGSLTMLVIGSAAAHCQVHRGRERGAHVGQICGRSRVGVDIAAGDVERRQGGFRVLRQAAPPGLDEARDRLVGARRADLAQYLGTAAQLARQYDERAIDVDPRAVDHDGAGDAEL